MPRKISPQTSDFPFHITGRRHNKKPFDIELSRVWQIMSQHLYLTNIFFGLRIHAFVLMPNHFHLICSTNGGSLGECFNFFMRETSKVLNYQSGNLNQTWGARFYRCEIPNYGYYMNCYKYLYQNPVRANLTGKCEHWPYSTLHGKLGQAHLLIPVVEDLILFSDVGRLNQDNLNWLNTAPAINNVEAIKKALRRRSFKLPKGKSQTAHSLETGLL